MDEVSGHQGTMARRIEPPDLQHRPGRAVKVGLIEMGRAAMMLVDEHGVEPLTLLAIMASCYELGQEDAKLLSSGDLPEEREASLATLRARFRRCSAIWSALEERVAARVAASTAPAAGTVPLPGSTFGSAGAGA